MSTVKIMLAKLEGEHKELRRSNTKVLKDTTYIEKKYRKIDHIVGIRTLDILVRDIERSNNYKALDIYLRIINSKYIRYSGFLDKLGEIQEKDILGHTDKDGNRVICNGEVIPKIEIVALRKLLSELRSMRKYVNSNVGIINKKLKSTARKDLIGVCKSRLSKDMIKFSGGMRESTYDYRLNKLKVKNNCIDIVSKGYKENYTKELDILGEYKEKLTHKARVALIYNKIKTDVTCDEIKGLLVYEKYGIAISDAYSDEYIDNIVKKLLREKISKDTLDKLDTIMEKLVESLEENLDIYNGIKNTNLVSYLTVSILDSLY